MSIPEFHLIDNIPTITIIDQNEITISLIVQNTEEIQYIPINSIFTVYRGYVKLKLNSSELENHDKLLEIWTPL